ncbi:MAG: glutaredoxin family protein [bacterium]|nr:glutaredoxin family protein [bacterium]
MTERPSPSSDTAERSILARVLNPHGLSTRGIVLQLAFCVALAILVVDQVASSLYWPAEDADEILVVSSERCPWSRAARQRLDAHGVDYRVIDAREDWLETGLAGWAYQSLSVPIVVVGPEVIQGYDERRIDAALARLGHGLPDETAVQVSR